MRIYYNQANKKSAIKTDILETAHNTEIPELSPNLSIANQKHLSSPNNVDNKRPWRAGELHPSISGRQLRNRHYAPPTASPLYQD